MNKMHNKLVAKIAQSINGTPYSGNVYIAGGFVRDFLMGRPSNDIDLVVANIGSNGGIELAYHLHRMFNTPTPVVFKRFGTAQIVIDGEEIEIVATRKETYNFDDRFPTVEFGTIKDDVMRRDFNINSILYNITDESFVDIMGGMFDINNRIIQTTSNPEIIFAEDPLRIMRAVRFAAQLGFDIDTRTLIAIQKFVPWLKNISNERIQDELNKILLSDNVIDGLWYLKSTGILGYIIPEFKELYKIKNQGSHHVKNAWMHTLDVVRNSACTVEARLAALLHDIGKAKTMTIEDGEIHFYAHQFVSRKIAFRFMTDYKYSTEQIVLVTKAIELHMNFIEEMLPKTIRKIVNEIGKESFLFAIDLAEADSKHRDRIAIVQKIREFVLNDDYIPEQVMKMPITGDMIMERYNLKPSKRIGELLAVEKELLFEYPEASNFDIFRKLDIEMSVDGIVTIYQFLKPEKPAEFITVTFNVSKGDI